MELRGQHEKLRQVIQKAFMTRGTGGSVGAGAGAGAGAASATMRSGRVDRDVNGADALSKVDSALMVFQSVDVLDMTPSSTVWNDTEAVRTSPLCSHCVDALSAIAGYNGGGVVILSFVRQAYKNQIDNVESAITMHLKERLGAAKSSEEMFRVFSQFNVLLTRPRVQKAIQQFQTTVRLRRRAVPCHRRAAPRFRMRCNAMRLDAMQLYGMLRGMT